MNVKVLGLDLAMVETGLCHTVEGAACLHSIRPKTAKDLRLLEIQTHVREQVQGSHLVLIEMLPPNMKGAGITGMVQGVIRAMLLDLGIPYGDLGPSSLKKFATGRGGASKTEMALAALKRGGVELPNDNQCDAWWLWVAANEHLGQPVIELPKIQREELRKIEMKG